jgi:hypothetical protein
MESDIAAGVIVLSTRIVYALYHVDMPLEAARRASTSPRSS